jgi:hypothetical protein
LEFWVEFLENANILILIFNMHSNGSRKMLGALAAIALVVGTVSATVSVTQHGHQLDQKSGEPVVEVQAVQSLDSVSK